MMLWMAVGLIVGVFGIAHVVFIREEYTPGKLNNQALKRLAEELHLEFSLDMAALENAPCLTGKLDGTVERFRITAREESLDTGGPVPFRCIYEIQTSGHSLSDKLLLYREGPPSRVGKVLGGEDIEVGHNAIDHAFVIRDISPDSAQQMFARPGVAEAFMYLTTLTSRVTFENHKLSIIHTGMRLDAHHARLNIMALVRCAALLCDASNQQTNYDEQHVVLRSLTQGAAPTWQAAP